MFGALCLFLVDLKVSWASPEALVGTANQPVIAARIWLFVIAIIAHNIPEGMAIGVSAGRYGRRRQPGHGHCLAGCT